ncbi:MAG: hypothetical protein DMG33_10405, partial [Acidobacteria bacterium]
LLDIGAVWCHWCHVIDRESYENSAIAQIINQHFVAVKVDRDERPDVDARYQAAISAISGQGGWPLTGFLKPDGRPFFGGTYFPPEDAMGRPGFRRILLAVAESYRNKRGEIAEAAESLAAAVAKAESFHEARATFDPGVVESQITSILQLFDMKNGGFGRAPKFPHSSAVDLVLERYQQTKEKHLLAVAESTLEKMARGGVYDQLAGGFHRYSVDERWLVPHFEKMSYDNSELLRNYLHAWQITRNPFLRKTAEGIIGWVDEVLSDQARGGFYASQDADYSLEDDGDYFTWTLDELRAALSPDEARAMELYYDVEPSGEMHHNPAKNVLWIARDAADIARNLGRDETEIRLLIARAKGKLLEARKPRPTPFVDETPYVAWNAMFVSAYLDAARVLGGGLGERCRAFALKTLDRMLAEAWNETRGFGHRVGGGALEGLLDDQVFSILALLDASGRWIWPSSALATPKPADFLTALPTPRPWAGSTCAGSHFRIRRRRARIPPRPSRSSACTPTRITAAIVNLRRRRWKPLQGSRRSTGCLPRATGWRLFSSSGIRFKSWLPAARRIRSRRRSSPRQTARIVSGRRCFASSRTLRSTISRSRSARRCRTCRPAKPWLWSAPARAAFRPRASRRS